MTELILGGGPPPSDDPLRRLVWVLPLAVLLVLLAVVGASVWLREPTVPRPPRQAPINARIYELPPARASAPSRPHPFAAHAHAPPPVASSKVAPIAPKAGLSLPRPTRSEPARVKPPRPAQRAAPVVPEAPPPVLKSRARTPRAPKPKSRQPARSAPHKPAQVPPAARLGTLNWGRLTSQINSVASSVVSHSAFNQVHDPHTLVARYYIAAVLEKLQRIGDMVYDGQQSGAVDVRFIIGSDGSVQALVINGRNGASGLEHVARHIVHLSAPFAPFPSKLARRTKRMKLTVYMTFLGIHHVNAR